MYLLSDDRGLSTKVTVLVEVSESLSKSIENDFLSGALTCLIVDDAGRADISVWLALLLTLPEPETVFSIGLCSPVIVSEPELSSSVMESKFG